MGHLLADLWTGFIDVTRTSTLSGRLVFFISPAKSVILSTEFDWYESSPFFFHSGFLMSIYILISKGSFGRPGGPSFSVRNWANVQEKEGPSKLKPWGARCQTWPRFYRPYCYCNACKLSSFVGRLSSGQSLTVTTQVAGLLLKDGLGKRERAS